MEWNTANITVIVLAILGAASAIAKITPTKSDDNIISKIYKLIHFFGLTKK